MTVMRCNDEVVRTSRPPACAITVVSFALIGMGQNGPSMHSDRPRATGSVPAGFLTLNGR